MTDAERLTEATALLVTIRARLISSHPESASDIDACLSQTPAPAATPALTGAELADRYGFQPHGLAPYVAAATPAPEPSADTPDEGESDLSAALARVEFETERADTAEAQLAAVRGVVEQTERIARLASGDRARANFLAIGFAQIHQALLSPGGGTVEKPYRATCRLCAAALNRDTGSSLEPSDCPACGTVVCK